jgi:hypothetical protein
LDLLQIDQFLNGRMDKNVMAAAHSRQPEVKRFNEFTHVRERDIRRAR